MELFFELEIAYITIGIFFLIITAIVTTQSTLPKNSFKYGMIGVFSIFSGMIAAHYFFTVARMDGVREIFNNGEVIICENKMRKTISRSVLVSKELGWRLEGNKFTSDDFARDFHISRCVDYSPIDPADIPK